MNDGERARVCHDAPMREAAAVADDHHIARERYQHFLGAIENKPEIAFLAAVQIPIIGIRPRIERLAETGIDKDSDQEHPAIDADALDVSLLVIWRSNPRARLTDDCVALEVLEAHLRPFCFFAPHVMSRKSKGSSSIRFSILESACAA